MLTCTENRKLLTCVCLEMLTFFLRLEIRETGRCLSVLNTFSSIRDPKARHRSPTWIYRERSLVFRLLGDSMTNQEKFIEIYQKHIHRPGADKF